MYLNKHLYRDVNSVNTRRRVIVHNDVWVWRMGDLGRLYGLFVDDGWALLLEAIR